MFKFNLASFESVLDTEIKIKKSDISFDNEMQIEDEIILKLMLTKDTPFSVIVQAHISGVMTGSCARCLKQVKTILDNSFTVIYKRKDMMDNDDVESDVFPYQDNEIDIGEALNEAVLLATPMKLVCGENCKGLCPVCGKNLNEEECGHKIDLKINPFSGLDPEKFKRSKKEE